MFGEVGNIIPSKIDYKEEMIINIIIKETDIKYMLATAVNQWKKNLIRVLEGDVNVNRRSDVGRAEVYTFGVKLANESRNNNMAPFVVSSDKRVYIWDKLENKYLISSIEEIGKFLDR